MSIRDRLLLRGKCTELATLKSKVRQFRNSLIHLCDRIEQDAAIEYTGYFVLLEQNGDSWEFLEIYNPDKDIGDAEPEWDLALPIPTLKTAKEFMGW